MDLFNSNLFKKLLRFSKKKYAPEEWFFETLFFNIFPLKQNKAINIFFYKIDKINSKFEVLNLKNEKIIFLRRIQGLEEIKNIRKMFN